MQSSGESEELLDGDDDSNRLVNDDDGANENFSISIPNAVPEDIPRWKRNGFRIFMVCLTAASAMFLKNYFIFYKINCCFTY